MKQLHMCKWSWKFKLWKFKQETIDQITAMMHQKHIFCVYKGVYNCENLDIGSWQGEECATIITAEIVHGSLSVWHFLNTMVCMSVSVFLLVVNLGSSRFSSTNAYITLNAYIMDIDSAIGPNCLTPSLDWSKVCSLCSEPGMEHWQLKFSI